MPQVFEPHNSPFLNGIFAPVQTELDDTPLELLASEIPADVRAGDIAAEPVIVVRPRHWARSGLHGCWIAE
jgi:carotenoid cleavage dioxygenase-like enzyme